MTRLITHVTQLAKFQQIVSELQAGLSWKEQQGDPLFCPGALVKIPDLNSGLTYSLWESPYPLFYSHLWQCEEQNWMYESITFVTSLGLLLLTLLANSASLRLRPTCSSYSCEPLRELKLPFGLPTKAKFLNLGPK